jgi:hypothetical protein
MTDLPLIQPSTDDEASTGEIPVVRSRMWSRNRTIIVSVLAGIVVLLVIIGAVAWHYLAKDSITLKPPASAAGLTLDDSADAQQTAEFLGNAVAAKMPMDDSVGAVYHDPVSKDRDVLFFGGTKLFLNPGKDLDQALTLLNDSSGAVTGLRDVPAGSLGGVMRCGTSTGDGGPMVVCGWADRGSLGIALFPGRTVDQAAQILRDLRTAMEHT